MAGEEGTSEQRTVKSLAAHEDLIGGPFLKPCTTTIHLAANSKKADAGQERPLNGYTINQHLALNPCTNKRKAEEAAAGEESSTKRKVEADASDSSAKKISRMPQEEVDDILAHVVNNNDYFEFLKRKNPDLLPSPEEENDESTVDLYTAARDYYAAGDAGESFIDLQNFVREQYRKHGYVEVDEDFVTRRAQVMEWNLKAKEEVLRDFALSDSDED